MGDTSGRQVMCEGCSGGAWRVTLELEEAVFSLVEALWRMSAFVHLSLSAGVLAIWASTEVKIS